MLCGLLRRCLFTLRLTHSHDALILDFIPLHDECFQTQYNYHKSIHAIKKSYFAGNNVTVGKPSIFRMTVWRLNVGDALPGFLVQVTASRLTGCLYTS